MNIKKMTKAVFFLGVLCIVLIVAESILMRQLDHSGPAPLSVSKVICPSESGRIEITWAKGSYIDFSADTFDHCVLVTLTPAPSYDLPNKCNSHGPCTNASESADCNCTDNWDPATNCSTCLAGFQDNDGNGVCKPACSSSTCSGNGTCSDTRGEALCTCDLNWVGEFCDRFEKMPKNSK